ncbi:MAG: DUF4167 domain-containing protein [Methylovirgula sp.]
MQNGSQRNMKSRRHGPDAGPSSNRSSTPERKPSSSAAARLADAKKNYERYMALARASASTGDAIQIENYYQHAEHYLRAMREQAA